MRNSIIWKSASPPTGKQKETKLKYHHVKGKGFARGEKNYWMMILCFPQIQVYTYNLK